MNRSYLTDHFESRKNWRAFTYTILICILIVSALLWISWGQPVLPSIPVEEGIEVNLGNSDQGMGNDQPYLPGKPSQQDQAKYTPPKQAVVEKTAYKDVETNDKEEDVPAVKKPPVTKPQATRIPDKEIAKNKPVRTAVPVLHPEPAPPKPKAVFHGVNGNGTGGNDADDYKPGTNQGIAGGKGDQGQPGGDPNATNYKGGGRGNSGVSISRGLQGRHFTALPSFTDDFNDNAKVAVDIHVDAGGNVIDAEYQPRGSTTADASMKAIALRKARQIRFNANSDESVGTIVFNFKIRN